MTTYYVYLDWTVEICPRIFYVGKGNIRRVGDCKKRNKLWKSIARKYGHYREIVFATSDEKNAFDFEIELIAKHRTFTGAENYVFGANFTRGGPGPLGFRSTLSEKHRLKLRKPRTKLHRKNQSKSLKGHTVTCSICKTPGHNKKICKMNTDEKQSPHKGKLKTCRSCGELGHNKRSCKNLNSRRRIRREKLNIGHCA